MAKRRPDAVIKVMATGGQAHPAPPLGPVLSQHRPEVFLGGLTQVLAHTLVEAHLHQLLGHGLVALGRPQPPARIM